VYIRALEQVPLRGVVVRDSTFRGVTNGHVIEGDVDLTFSHVITEAAEKEKKP
jgi:hypothetical protein